MDSDIDNLFERRRERPAVAAAGLLADAPPRPAKGYVTVPLAWLARVLPVVRSTGQFVVAMLLYRECLTAPQQHGRSSNGELTETRHQPLHQISGFGWAARGRGDRDREAEMGAPWG